MLAGEHRETGPLGAGDDHQRALQIRLRQRHAALAGQADHAVALLLELVEGAVEVDHPGHGQVLQGAGGHLGHRAGEASAAALGQHQAVGAEGLGAAHDGAQVVGIGDAVEGHQQGRFPQLTATVDEAVEVEGVGGGHLQHDALVHGPTGELTQPRPGDLLHQHAAGLGFAQQLQEARLEAHFGGAPDAVNRAIALQGGLGAVATPDQVVGRGGTEAFRFTGGGGVGGINRHLPRAVTAAIVEGGAGLVRGATRGAEARATRATLGATLWAAAPEAGAIGANAVTARGVGPGGLKAAFAAAAKGFAVCGATALSAEGPIAPKRTLGALGTLGATRTVAAAQGALTALGAVATGGAIAPLRAPFAAGGKGAGATTGRAATGPGKPTLPGSGALALVPTTIKTGAHGQTGKGSMGRRLQGAPAAGQGGWGSAETASPPLSQIPSPGHRRRRHRGGVRGRRGCDRVSPDLAPHR